MRSLAEEPGSSVYLLFRAFFNLCEYRARLRKISPVLRGKDYSLPSKAGILSGARIVLLKCYLRATTPILEIFQGFFVTF